MSDDGFIPVSDQSTPTPSDSGIMSFIRGVGNNLPLGAQASALLSPGKYSTNMAAINDAVSKDKSKHPIAYGSGSILGTLAPGFIPGVGETMAANPMTSGALLGSTNAISNTDIQKDPIQVTHDAVNGAATGALMSGLISKLLPSRQSLESHSNLRANASVNMPKNVLINMTPEEQQTLGSSLRSGGVVSSDKQEALSNAESLLENYGQTIGSIGKTTESQGLTADPGHHYSAIGKLLNSADEFSGSANKISKAIGRDYKAGAQDVFNLGDNPSWGDIQSLKEKYGDISFNPNSTKGAKDTYFALSDMLKNIADRAQSNPSLSPQYKQALAGYSQMSPVVDGLRSLVDSDLRGGGGSGIGFHPMRMLASMPRSIRAPLGALAVGTGHPLLGVAAALPEAMNPAIQSKVLGGMSSAMPTIQNSLTQSATRLGTNSGTSSQVNPLLTRLKDKVGSFFGQSQDGFIPVQ